MLAYRILFNANALYSAHSCLFAYFDIIRWDKNSRINVKLLKTNLKRILLGKRFRRFEIVTDAPSLRRQIILLSHSKNKRVYLRTYNYMSHTSTYINICDNVLNNVSRESSF